MEGLMGPDDQSEKKFLFIGNHPYLDFINTQIAHNRQPVDLLETFSDLVSWLVEAQLLDREEAKQAEWKWIGKPEGMRTLDQARGFRAALREMIERIASDLLCTCDLSLIKQCQNPVCVLFFNDTTKNHARHWCSMSVCGNRIKVAAQYRRHRVDTKQSTSAKKR